MDFTKDIQLHPLLKHDHHFPFHPITFAVNIPYRNTLSFVFPFVILYYLKNWVKEYSQLLLLHINRLSICHSLAAQDISFIILHFSFTKSRFELKVIHFQVDYPSFLAFGFDLIILL